MHAVRITYAYMDMRHSYLVLIAIERAQNASDWHIKTKISVGTMVPRSPSVDINLILW